MRYLFLLYDVETGRPDVPPEQLQAILEPWIAYTAELEAAGVYVGGDALQATSTATTLRMADGDVAITDGPFAETTEQLGGYYMVDVPDLDAALHWARKCPIFAGGGSLEIRPIETFGE